MTPADGRTDGNVGSSPRPVTLVWIDAREAVVVRWADGAPSVTTIASDVAPRHRSQGHVRHDPAFRHGGGGGVAQTTGEPRRLEHLARFLATIAGRLPAADDILVLGPGTVPDRLAALIRRHDDEHHVERAVTSEAASRLTSRQLVVRLREAMGVEPRRHTVGAYRWTDPAIHGSTRSAAAKRIGAKETPATGLPRRVRVG